MLEGGENLCLRPPSRMIQLSLRLQIMAFTVTCFSYFKGRFAAFRADLTMSILGICVSRVPGREPVTTGQADDFTAGCFDLLDQGNHSGSGGHLVLSKPFILAFRSELEVHEIVFHIVGPQGGVIGVEHCCRFLSLSHRVLARLGNTRSSFGSNGR